MKKLLWLVSSLSILAASCDDPVHSDAITALGGEINGERPGPTHRAGQPCLVCHGSSGPQSPEFSVAGTVFDVRNSTTGLAGVSVTLTDATGAQRVLESNRVGNFYIETTAWVPVFPLHVSLSSGSVKKDMVSRIGRDGACATCHRGTGDTVQMPGVFLSDK